MKLSAIVSMVVHNKTIDCFDSFFQKLSIVTIIGMSNVSIIIDNEFLTDYR